MIQLFDAVDNGSNPEVNASVERQAPESDGAEQSACSPRRESARARFEPTMRILVQKYGGSSLGSTERIEHVAERIRESSRSQSVVAVVSAMGDTTDRLIDLARRLSVHPERREIDMLLSTGEQVSASLLAMALHERGCPAVSLAGWQAGIRTDSAFSAARIREVDGSRISHELDAGRVVIVTGFQGIAADSGWDEVTTLGRGGSDATAVALAAGLGAACCEIYTDVEGIFTADPRLVPSARKLDDITYEEMLELAHSGAQVLMPRSVELAQLWKVDLEVRSSFSGQPGTRIGGTMEYANRVVGVAHQAGVAKITFVALADRPGVAETIFSALVRRQVHADLIVQNIGHGGRTDLSFTVQRGDLDAAVEAAEAVRDQVGAREVLVKEGMARVSVVGAGLTSTLEHAATTFGALGKEGINIDMISTSGIRITCVIEGGRVEDAVRALHEAFALGVDGSWQATA